MKSHWQQYLLAPDGTIAIKSQPGIRCGVIEEHCGVFARNIEAELGLPKSFETWEELAKPRGGFSGRKIQFIVMDESETRLPGHYRFQPQRITLPNTCHLEFGHRGFVVGIVHPFFLGFDELCALTHSLSGIEIPKEMKSDYVIAEATLFDSPLAEKAWDAIRLGIFSHVCPLVFRKIEEPAGTGQLVEVSLTSADYPGCPGAKILKMWDTGA